LGTWLGSVVTEGSPWLAGGLVGSIKCYDFADAYSGQNLSTVFLTIAPAFNLDPSQVTLDGTTIKLTPSGDSNSGNGTEQQPSYVVEIPDTLQVQDPDDGIMQISDNGFTITATLTDFSDQDVLEIEISSANDFKLKNENDTEGWIAYKLDSETSITFNNTTSCSRTITATITENQARYAATYEDTLTFTYSVKQAQE
jgi:hypothetical protein